jgi:hypothetical protein
MSEHLSVVASMRSAAVSETRAERRQMRRAGISLPVRIRTADFNDGNFDEVRMTQNASRKAIYFFTELNRYYKGMRLRVTSPYDANAGAANLEQVGEVVRVHRRNDGYGVAVAILSGQATSVKPAVESGRTETRPVIPIASSSPNERRCGVRSPFVAPVEMVEMRTGSRIQARTSDLSVQGCYVDTLNPLPVGASVRLQIHRAGLILDVLANVSARHEGSGMGLMFAGLANGQKVVLESWLSELGLPRAISENPFPVSSKVRAQHESDSAARLVQMLLRKGLLSQSEATEVLDSDKG